MHNRPSISQTVLIPNMYQSPDASASANDSKQRDYTPEELQEHFDDFYDDVFLELSKFGELEDLHVCDNLADHLVGNVYAKFKDEDGAYNAMQGLAGRFYEGRPIMAEFSPVTDFREATCRQYEENTCTRGGYCNFMHLKPISPKLRKKLFGRRSKSKQRSSRKRSRSRSRRKSHSRSHDKHRSSRREKDEDHVKAEEKDKQDGDRPDTSKMSEEERRKMFEQWNQQRQMKDKHGGNGASDDGE
jgi:splicing factor U2AF subunit